MNNWLKRMQNPVRFCSETGSEYKIVYKPRLLKDGSVDLVESEKKNLFDYIQSFKDSCDINVLLRRYQQGDTAALMAAQGFYADISEMPTNYAEMLNIVISGQSYFDSLPSEVKEKFDNNYYKFCSSIGSEEFVDALGIKSAQVEEKPLESEVKVDE